MGNATRCENTSGRRVVASSSSTALRSSRHRVSRHRSSRPRSSCSRCARNTFFFSDAPLSAMLPMSRLSPGGVAPSIGAVLAATAALISRDCSVSRDCGSAQISVATSSELAAVFAFALAFGAFSALATSVFHDPSFRVVSFFVVFSKTAPHPS